MDCCICVRARFLEDEVAYEGKGDMSVSSEEDEENDLGKVDPPVPQTLDLHWTDRFMVWYADKLLRPKVQIAVLIGFVTLLGVSLYYTTQLTQFFDLNDMVPQDSYLREYFNSLSLYAKNRTGLPSYAFFRDVDHSDPAIREQMVEFVDELVKSGSIASPPTHFWIHDFDEFLANNANTTFEGQGGNETFYDQVSVFLKEPPYNELYHDHIILNTKTGYIMNSRCEIYVNVDIGDASGGIDALESLRSVSMAQPINDNMGHSEWKMFTYQDMYNLWEFYSAVISELSFSTVMGVVAVCMVGILLIPHWTALFYIAPLIICLYIDMLGYISYSGINVNAISYVQLVMSIGLMVDFIMHVLMRYYETEGNRREKVQQTLQTMGSSIFVGGFPLSWVSVYCILVKARSSGWFLWPLWALLCWALPTVWCFYQSFLSLIGPE